MTVALSGDGGDEFFGGYDRYRAVEYYRRYFAKVPGGIRALAGRLEGVVSERTGRFLKLLKAPDVAAFAASYTDILRYVDPAALIPSESLAEGGFDGSVEFLRALATRSSPVEAAMLYDATHAMIDGILVKVDRATMAFGLEARSPLLDKQVVEFALRSPLHMKIRGSDMKYALRKLLARSLPRDLIDRPKMGLSPPLGQWFRNELRNLLCDALSPESVAHRGLFLPAGVSKYLEEHLQGKRNHEYLLWSLMQLELWMRESLDRASTVERHPALV
ncbi:MAG: asparagine synthase-related protein [Pirellulales bacterium]